MIPLATIVPWGTMAPASLARPLKGIASGVPPRLPSPATRFSQDDNMDRMNATDNPYFMPYLSLYGRVAGDRAVAHELFRELRGLALLIWLTSDGRMLPLQSP